MVQPPPQSDFDKLRRLPFLYGYQCLTGVAVLCTVGAPMVLFAAELGISRDRIGLLGGMMPFFQILGLACLPIVLHFGPKKVAANALMARYFFLLPFLIAPLLPASTAFPVLLAAIAGYAICRTLSEAAVTPWSQEFIPRPLRGMVSGRMSLIYLPFALIVSYLVQLWLDASDGIGRFYGVFIFGIIVGVLGGALLYGLGGGVAKTEKRSTKNTLRALRKPLADKNFRKFLVSSGLQYLVFQSLGIYLVLFFRERLGLSAGQLVLLAALIPLGSTAGSVAAGWLIDRSGTRGPRLTLQYGQIALMLALPLLGPELPYPAAWAGAAFFLYGMLVQGAMMAGNIYMLNYVPENRRESYMTLAYSSDGLFGGVLTVLAGIMVQRLETAPLWGGKIGGYETLFLLSSVLVLASLWLFSRLEEKGAEGLRSFLSQFATGNPLRALWGIRSYASLNSEERRRELAHNFAGIGSGLATSELLAALSDPSFDVRHEAIRALAHVPPSPTTISAVENVLAQRGLLELQYAALETLGRLGALGSRSKITPFLEDPSTLLRARAARALGEMKDRSALTALRTILADDPDVDCRLAAASALGKLQDHESLPALARLYNVLARAERGTSDEPRSHVILLAMSKILGIEAQFSQLWRTEIRIPGFGLPDALSRLSHALPEGPLRIEALTAASAAEPKATAFEMLAKVIQLVENKPSPASDDLLPLLRSIPDLPKPDGALAILLCLATAQVIKG